MAIQTTDVRRINSEYYIVTVQDTSNQTGTDENSLPIYKKYSARYYPKRGSADLKSRLESEMLAKKTTDSTETSIKADIKTAVESIDISKIGV